MKKFGKFFSYAAILLILGIGGCGFDPPLDTGDAAADPTLSPPPAGKVWVKIPLPGDSARTLTGTNNLTFVDYYEVFFVTRDTSDIPTFEDMGKAVPGEVLAVSVYPDETYSVLLLAGHYKTRALMASAYADAFKVEAGKVNTLNLELKYIKSDPTEHLSFTGYTPATGETSPVGGYKPINGNDTYYQFKTVTVSSGGTGYSKGDRLLLTPSTGFSATDLKPVVVVTEVINIDEIKKVSIENPGCFAGVVSGTASSAIIGPTPNTTALFSFETETGDTNRIPDNVLWLSYIGGRGVAGNIASNPLVFTVKTDNIKPLLEAGGIAGKGSGHFAPQKVELRITDIQSGGFSPVQKVVTPPAQPTNFTVDADTDGGTITAKYTLDQAADFPGAGQSGYGAMFYRLEYKAFGLDAGSPWSIRSGRDLLELDGGELSTGAAILVRIGNPGKYTDKVDVTLSGF
jgi:hypothetical protein